MRMTIKKKMTEFEVTVSENSFVKSDILLERENCYLEVLENPYRKWYKILFQFITFGLYKAPWQYKVKLISKNDEET